MSNLKLAMTKILRIRSKRIKNVSKQIKKQIFEFSERTVEKNSK